MSSARWLDLALLVAIACFATWKVDAWRYAKELASLTAAHQADLTTISNAAATQVRQALEKQQATQKALAELDVKATKEKASDLAGAAGRTVFDIRAGIIKDRAALKGLQVYVRKVCQ